MEFLYTVDPNSDEPIMLIDSHIGTDEEDGEGIVADKFCRELLFLDTLNKSKINIWINSPGGSVLDGMQIFNTILKTKTKIDTHCVGMAASIAAPIFLAGRTRYMMDNSVLMVHPVSGGTDEGRKVFDECVNAMISSRSYLTPERVKGMMDATTWLNAHECGEMGLCVVESSGSFNRPRSKPDLSDVKNAYKSYKTLVNSAIEHLKPKTMSKVTNKLKLVDGSNEDAQVAAIDAIENRVSEAENKTAKMKTDLDEATNKAETLKNELDKAKADLKAADDAKEKAENDKKEAEATTEITNAVKLGKIKNDEKVIAEWKKNYLANPAGTKNMLEAISTNRKAPDLKNTAGGLDDEKELTNVAGAAMAEARNRLKI